ncbi:hypothetical protein Q5P01_023042 [Channa striata]|uniref:Uncharacterized protein n=1 Tax=Channa striata TaxID=64152 RepID=A0AA88LKS6_CHASR|nr:hypothetical protein Q5P01_023042 [Channa striata]
MFLEEIVEFPADADSTSVQREAPAPRQQVSKTATSEAGQRTTAIVHVVPPEKGGGLLEPVRVPPPVRDTCTVATMTEVLKQSPGDWGRQMGKIWTPCLLNQVRYGMGDRMIREVQEEQPARRKGRRGWYSQTLSHVFGGNSGVPADADSDAGAEGGSCATAAGVQDGYVRGRTANYSNRARRPS